MIRPLHPDDLPAADAAYRAAFAEQFGLSPEQFRPGSAVLPLRLRGQPHCCFAAEQGGRVVGSIVGLDWGSAWILGPLTIVPAAQGQGLARALVDAFLAAAGQRLVGLWTFPASLKHVALYQKAGFLPRSLVGIGTLPAAPGPLLAPATKAALSFPAVYPGLDLGREQGGIVGVLPDGDGAALFHAGPNTEAGPDELYVKFAAATGADSFARLLQCCAAEAAARGLSRVKAGVNTARRAAWAALQAQGWRPAMFGVAMHRPDIPAWDRGDAWVIDDWQ